MGRLYEEFAIWIVAYENCSNQLQKLKYLEHLETLVKMHMPHGSGIDNGVMLLLEKSNKEKLVFQVDYHHMDDNGMYDGWSHHTATVTASLYHGINIRMGGRNRNKVKEMLVEILWERLMKEVG